MKKIVLLFSFFYIFLFLSNAVSAYYYSGYGMMGENGGIGYWGMGFGFILFTIFWIFLIFLGFYMFKNIKHLDLNHKNFPETPEDLLKKRLASGEINEKEYDKLKKKIGEK